MIDGDGFIKRFNALDEESKARLDKVAKMADYTIPSCPSCDTKMLKRVSQKGKNPGSLFWGCCNFPRCRQTLQARKENNA